MSRTCHSFFPLILLLFIACFKKCNFWSHIHSPCKARLINGRFQRFFVGNWPLVCCIQHTYKFPTSVKQAAIFLRRTSNTSHVESPFWPVVVSSDETVQNGIRDNIYIKPTPFAICQKTFLAWILWVHLPSTDIKCRIIDFCTQRLYLMTNKCICQFTITQAFLGFFIPTLYGP